MDENKDIRVSVIVPFYNAGKHIERCAESLMRQTLKDGIEFVFVNDGSTDDSLDKLVSVVSKYSPIKVLRLHARKGMIVLLAII